MSHETTEEVSLCGRCGKPLGEESSEISIESGKLQPTRARLVLCSHCTHSMERWLTNHRRRSRSSPSPKREWFPWWKRYQEARAKKKKLPPWKRATVMKEEARFREFFLLTVILNLTIMLAVVLLSR